MRRNRYPAERKKEYKGALVFATRTEVLQYIADGYTTREIAKKIFRDEETVKTHRRNLLIKIDAINTAVMIKKACEQNLVKINK